MMVTQPVTHPGPVAPPSQEREVVPVRATWQQWLPVILLTALLIAIYWGVIAKLVYDWYSQPDFSHGFLVPLFSAYLIWTKWETLRNDVKRLILVTAVAMVALTKSSPIDLYAQRLPNGPEGWPESSSKLTFDPEASPERRFVGQRRGWSSEGVVRSHIIVRRSSANVGKCLPLLCKKILNRKAGECSRLGSAADLHLQYKRQLNCLVHL